MIGDLVNVAQIWLRHLEYCFHIIWLVILDQLVQDRVSPWQYIVEHGLYLVLVDLGQVEGSLADRVNQIPMQECETQVVVLHLLPVHGVQDLVQSNEVRLVEQVLCGLVLLVFPCH